MSFQHIRRKQKSPQEFIVFRELLEDYKRFQKKRCLLTSLSQQPESDFLSTVKAQHAIRMTQIIQRELNTEGGHSMEYSNAFGQPKDSQNVQPKFGLTCTFRNQSRDQLEKNQKRGYFRDTFSNCNPFISAARKHKCLVSPHSQIRVFGNIHENSVGGCRENSVGRLAQMKELKRELEMFQQQKKQKLHLLKKMRIYKYEYPYMMDSQDSTDSKARFNIKVVNTRQVSNTKDNIFPRQATHSNIP